MIDFRIMEIITLVCDGMPTEIEKELIDFFNSIDNRIGELEKLMIKEPAKVPVKEPALLPIGELTKKEKCDVIILDDDGETD